MKKEELINLYTDNENREYMEILDKFYFTYSQLKDIIEMLNEFKEFRLLGLKDIIEKFEFKFSGDKKKDASLFIKKLRAYRYPVMTESFEKAEKYINKIKKKNVKLDIPQNFEGSGIKIEINFEKRDEVEKTIEHLNSNLKNIEDLLNLVKRGG